MKTVGEQAFEKYLNSLKLKFDYEPPIGQRRPDYLVGATSGDVLCEVKDLEQNDEEAAELQAIIDGRSDGVGAREMPFDRIQLKIRAAAKQLREFKGRYPSLVVLFNASAQVALIDFTVLGAMFGKTLITVPIVRGDGGDAEEAQPSVEFERESRYLTRTSNTTISAVAILEKVTPNQKLVDEALAKQRIGGGPDGLRDVLRFVYEFSEKHPEVFDTVWRLHIFKNPFAAVPWPDAAFTGPHDLLWRADG
jgi:hypothetical protein